MDYTIPEDGNIHNYRCENLNSNIAIWYLNDWWRVVNFMPLPLYPRGKTTILNQIPESTNEVAVFHRVKHQGLS
jgi:hypothetical protein